MSKEKFLESLRKKLSILEESEIEDILSEYEGYIEEKIKKGSSEEEAVKSMGNIDELARDLLSAYKIKNPNGKEHDGISSLVDSFINIFDRIISVFAHKSFNEIVKFFIELIFIFLIIAVCKIPFEIIGSMGRGIFSSFGNTSFHILFGVWNFILECAYLIFAILLFIKIFESRYLNGEYESIFTSEEKEDSKKENKEESKQVNKEEKKGKEKIVYKEKRERQNWGIIDALTKVCIWFMKFILLFFLFGIACFVIGMAMTLGIAAYFFIKGVFYFGIYLILIALFVIGIIAFIFLFNFIFDHKNKVGILLIVSLVSFVLLGIGTGICALEFASTTIVYNENSDKNATASYTYEMQDNLVLEWNLERDEIQIDDTLGNKIYFEYKYNDSYYQIEANKNINHRHGYEVLYYWYYVKRFTYKKDYFEKFLQDLRDKTIYVKGDNVGIVLHMSKKTYDKLLENKKKYDNYVEFKNMDLEDVCEELHDKGYALPNYCTELDDYQRM